jgi:hypothetical protein
MTALVAYASTPVTAGDSDQKTEKKKFGRPGVGGPGGFGGLGGFDSERVFKLLDTNNDGMLSLDEFKAIGKYLPGAGRPGFGGKIDFDKLKSKLDPELFNKLRDKLKDGFDPEAFRQLREQLDPQKFQELMELIRSRRNKQ